MSNDIEITENTLTADDLSLVKEALFQQQKVLGRRNIPGPKLFEIIQGKLSQELDVNLFRRALALSVATQKLPGIDSFAGRVGGFGPVKEIKEPNVTVSNPLPVVPVVSAPVVIPVVVEVPREEAPAIVDPPATSSAGSVEAEKIEEEEEEEEEEEDVSLFTVLKEVVEAVPAAVVKPAVSAPVIPIVSGVVWNKDKAKNFILAFALATGPGTQEYGLLRAKAETASVSPDTTRAIIRTALGFDPAKVNPIILQWQSLFDSAEEKSEEKKSA